MANETFGCNVVVTLSAPAFLITQDGASRGIPPANDSLSDRNDERIVPRSCEALNSGFLVHAVKLRIHLRPRNLGHYVVAFESCCACECLLSWPYYLCLQLVTFVLIFVLSPLFELDLARLLLRNKRQSAR